MEFIYKGKRVLSIGARKRVLKRFSEALMNQGFHAVWTTYNANIDAILSEFNATDFDVITFGRGVSSSDKQTLKQRFREQNEKIEFVDGLAPITNLLVEQIKLACMPRNHKQIRLEFDNKGNIVIENQASCYVTVKQYTLNWLYQSKEVTIIEKQLGSGIFRFPIKMTLGSNFIVVIQDGVVSNILSCFN